MRKRPLPTPLRYPGGKSKAIKKILPYCPNLQSVDTYYEPFLGGGSVALAVTKANPNIKVVVNDLYYPLYNFWTNLRDRGDEISDELIRIKRSHYTPDKARQLFGISKGILSTGVYSKYSSMDLAICFWIVNKCSFSGLTESSSFSESASNGNFTIQGIEDLKEYSRLIKNWTITNCSYEDVINKHVWEFKPGGRNLFYLDPPYEIESKLYGKKGNMHKGFDHDKFASECNNLKKDIDNFLVVSYNDCQSVQDRFPNWYAHSFDHTYTLRSNSKNYQTNQKARKELLLTSYDPHLIPPRGFTRFTNKE